MKSLYSLKAVMIQLTSLLSFQISSAQYNCFEKTVGGTNEDWAQSAVQTADGGFAFTGITYSHGAGGEDVFLVKTNADGDTLWCKTFGGPLDDYGYKIYNTHDGGLLITGHTKSFSSDCDGYVIKTDADGNELWEHVYGGEFDDVIHGATELPNGDFIMTGFTENYGAQGIDVYLIRTDSQGNLLWTKTIGGPVDEYGKYILLTQDGNVVLGCTTSSYGAGDNDFYLVKTDLDGNIIWTKTIGGTGNDDMWGMQAADDGGFIMTGVTMSFGDAKGDCYLVKANANGDEEWSKTFGGAGPDRGNGVCATSDGGFLMTGTIIPVVDSPGDAYLVKTDAVGNLLWSATYGGSNDDNGNSVVECSDQGIFIAGRTVSFGAGWSDAFLIRTDPLGNLITGESTLLHEKTVSISPDPFDFSTSLHITNPDPSGVSLVLFDVTGNMVKKLSNIVLPNSILYRDQLRAGIYFYSLVESDERVIDRGKIVIE